MEVTRSFTSSIVNCCFTQLLVVIFAVCVVLLQKFKMNPIWVMVLAGVIKTVVSLIVNVF